MSETKDDHDIVEENGAGSGTNAVPLEALESQEHGENALKPQITKDHHDYLLQRHGTADLHPLPSMDPDDPYNWPSWKVSCYTSPN